MCDVLKTNHFKPFTHSQMKKQAPAKKKRVRTGNPRGRPKSAEKALREAKQEEFTKDVVQRLHGLYTTMWRSIHEGGRQGFKTWCEIWCTQQPLLDGTIMSKLGNCLYAITTGLHENASWYECTRKQFMYQIADVAIIMHALLSMVRDVTSDRMSVADMMCRVSCVRQFTQWASSLAGNSRHGDILSAGHDDVLNFRRIMTDAAAFHAYHRLAPTRSDKGQQEQLMDLRCFSPSLPWLAPGHVDVDMRFIDEHKAVLRGASGVTVRVHLSPMDKTTFDPTDPLVSFAPYAHMASGATDPYTRGKFVKHVVGRMKTLIGCNCTISPQLAQLMNPSLTGDNTERQHGWGPSTWALICARQGETKVKQAKKKAKAELCARISKMPSQQWHLVWRMFRSPLHITDASGRTMTTEQPITDIKCDQNYYDHLRDTYTLKRHVMSVDMQEITDAGGVVADEVQQRLPECDTKSDISQLEQTYEHMLNSTTGPWKSAFFGCDKRIHVDANVSYDRGEDIAGQVATFKSIQPLLTTAPLLNRKSKCSMKDPDRWGFSWAPHGPRKRSAESVANSKQPCKRTHHTRPAATQHLLCSTCGAQARYPVVCTGQVGCLSCIWKTKIGPVALQAYGADHVITHGTPNLSAVRPAHDVWEDNTEVIVPIEDKCKQGQNEAQDERVAKIDLTLSTWMRVYSAIPYMHGTRAMLKYETANDFDLHDSVIDWHTTERVGNVLVGNEGGDRVFASTNQQIQASTEVFVRQSFGTITACEPSQTEYCSIYDALLTHSLDDAIVDRLGCRRGSLAQLLATYFVIKHGDACVATNLSQVCNHGDDLLKDIL